MPCFFNPHHLNNKTIHWMNCRFKAVVVAFFRDSESSHSFVICSMPFVKMVKTQQRAVFSSLFSRRHCRRRRLLWPRLFVVRQTSTFCLTLWHVILIVILYKIFQTTHHSVFLQLAKPGEKRNGSNNGSLWCWKVGSILLLTLKAGALLVAIGG